MSDRNGSGFYSGDVYDQFPYYRDLDPRSREAISTWAFLCSIGKARTSIRIKDDSIKREIINALMADQETIKAIKAWNASRTINDHDANQIPEDERSNRIIRRYFATRYLAREFLHKDLSERECTIATLDLPDPSKAIHQEELRKILSNLQEITKDDSIFNWFKGDQSLEKVSLAKSILDKEKTEPLLTPSSKAPEIKTPIDLIEYFDGFPHTKDSKQLFVNNVKKKWSQKKYREKNSTKKQKNFLLSEVTIKRLEKIAKMHDISQTQALEILIRMESKEKKYIKKRMNTVTITDDEPPAQTYAPLGGKPY